MHKKKRTTQTKQVGTVRSNGPPFEVLSVSVFYPASTSKMLHCFVLHMVLCVMLASKIVTDLAQAANDCARPSQESKLPTRSL